MTGTAEHWEHFEHGADIGVRGVAPTKAGAFEQAALALTAVLTDPAGLVPRERVTIDCAAPDDGLLLVDWLNAIVYEMAVRRLLFARYAVRFTPTGLHGEAWGEPVTPAHEPAVEVKGATYTALAVEQAPAGHWVAQCVVDV